MSSLKSCFSLLLISNLCLFSCEVLAIGSTIGRIVSPEVEKGDLQFEHELLILYDKPEINNNQRHRFSFEKAVSEHWAFELGITATRDPQQSFNVHEYELEIQYQFAGQEDLALLVEFERDSDEKSWDFTGSLIAQQEWQNWVATANISYLYEWSDEEEDEQGAELALQLKYTGMPSINPAIEYFRGENIDVLGPGFSGEFAVFDEQAISWQFGIGFSLDKQRIDRAVRLVWEYEF